MTVPLFIRIQGTLVNLAAIEVVQCEEETLCVVTGNETYEFEYADAARAGQAMQRVQALLAAKQLLIGEVV